LAAHGVPDFAACRTREANRATGDALLRLRRRVTPLRRRELGRRPGLALGS